MIRRALLAIAALVLPLLAMTPAAGAGNRLCPVDDPRLSEVSGIAAHVGDNQSTRSKIDVYQIPEPARPADRDPSATAAVVSRIRLPNQSQAEGVNMVGGALWLPNDGRDHLILTVALPRAVLLAPTTTASDSSSGPSSSSPAPGNGSSDSGIGWGLITIVAAAVMAFILGSRLRRRGRHKDQGGEDLSWTG